MFALPNSVIAGDFEWPSRSFQPIGLLQLLRTTISFWLLLKQRLNLYTIILSIQRMVGQVRISILLTIRFVERSTSLQWTSKCSPQCSTRIMPVLSSNTTMTWNPTSKSPTKEKQVCNDAARFTSAKRGNVFAVVRSLHISDSLLAGHITFYDDMIRCLRRI